MPSAPAPIFASTMSRPPRQTPMRGSSFATGRIAEIDVGSSEHALILNACHVANPRHDATALRQSPRKTPLLQAAVQGIELAAALEEAGPALPARAAAALLLLR